MRRHSFFSKSFVACGSVAGRCEFAERLSQKPATARRAHTRRSSRRPHRRQGAVCATEHCRASICTRTSCSDQDCAPARLFDATASALAINLSGQPTNHGFEGFIVDNQSPTGTCSVYWGFEAEQARYGARMAEALVAAKERRKVQRHQIYKALGLQIPRGRRRAALQVDDPGDRSGVEAAAELKLPSRFSGSVRKRSARAESQTGALRRAARAVRSGALRRLTGVVPFRRWQLYDAFLRRVARHPGDNPGQRSLGNAPERTPPSSGPSAR